MSRSCGDYAVYKGDEFIDLGTIEELSERLHIKKSTLRWYATTTSRKKRKNVSDILEVFRIEDDESEDDMTC